MDFLNHLKIATRLKVILGFMTAMLFGIAGLALWQMAVMSASTHQITTNWMPSVELVNRMNTATANFRAQEFKHVLSTDAQEMADVEKRMVKVKADFDKNHDAYVKLISSDEERKLYDAFVADWKVYLQMHEQLLDASRKNETDRARAMLDKESKPVFDSLSATLVKLINLNHDGSVAEGKGSDAAAVFGRNLMIGGGRGWACCWRGLSVCG